MNRWIKRAFTVTATTALIAGTTLAGSAKTVKTAKHATKFTPTTFVCRHGCKKNITVKTAADMKKTCPVCGCKKMISDCMPPKKTGKP